MDEIIKILDALEAEGIPYAYDHFVEGEGPDPPFFCFRCPNSDNFAADGTVYFPITEIDIELYTDKKDPEIEKKLEGLIIGSGIFFDKTETWIESERLYEVLYSFEKEA
nr:MAG TPA: tail completion protein [Caudoviricetes sp.]